MRKVVSLLSGGLDSTVLLSQLVKENEVVALSLDYGQLHKRELEYAQYQAEKYGCQWILKDIKAIFQDMENPLLGSGTIPNKSYAEQLAEKKGTVVTYVPFRNGILLSIATAVAYSVGAEAVYYGAHMDDAAGSAYPDCTPVFASCMDSAIMEGTGGKVALFAPFLQDGYNKKDIVRVGKNNNVDFSHTWSCYKGGDRPCGVCGTCLDRKTAMEANGIHD